MKHYVVTASLICLLGLMSGCASTTPIAKSDAPSKDLAEKSSRLSPSRISKPETPLKEFIRTNSAVSSLFSKYDSSVQATIRKNWFALIDDPKVKDQATGKVKLSFQIYYDGKITDIKILENTVSPELEQFCEKAIMSGVPYPRWSNKMIQEHGASYRTAAYTFYYR